MKLYYIIVHRFFYLSQESKKKREWLLQLKRKIRQNQKEKRERDIFRKFVRITSLPTLLFATSKHMDEELLLEGVARLIPQDEQSGSRRLNLPLKKTPHGWGGQFSRDSFPLPMEESKSPRIPPSTTVNRGFLSGRNTVEHPSTHPDHSIMSNSLSISQPFVATLRWRVPRISTPLLRRFSWTRRMFVSLPRFVLGWRWLNFGGSAGILFDRHW